MSRYYGGWAPYVSVAERRKKAAREVIKLRKKGQVVAPIEIEGRKITTTFWGKSWCDNLESYHDFENRLPRGRTYLRNGSVIDLQISENKVQAMVSGSSIYKVSVGIAAVPKAQWKSICNDCAGGIDSLVELLQGRFSKGIMERLCRQDKGLFPKPSEIEFSCSCPDYATMCKHVAAVLYGIGSRLDKNPEMLFHLRAVDEKDLVAHADTALPLAKNAPDANKVLEADDLSALFGLDMAEGRAGGLDVARTKHVKKGKNNPATVNAIKPPKPQSEMSARQEKAIWREIEELIPRCNSSAYTQATELLLDLSKHSKNGKRKTIFRNHLAALRSRHERKRKFIEMLDRANFD
ncbi:MAG: SWIM zinc finger family protein [Proteobacteria bacterium]|nr:SWIM zinc finger family protein [Pseudomonadota bacterium]MDA1023652.1 SWIM zinc finger family protein [Pseudomonadota bacterium]